MHVDYYNDNISDEDIPGVEDVWLAGVVCGGASGSKQDGYEAAFSGRTIVGQAVQNSFNVGLTAWAPSRKSRRARRHALAMNARNNGFAVSNDFGALGQQTISVHGRDRTLLVVGANTGAGLAALQSVDDACGDDAEQWRFAFIDKPGVASVEQYQQMMKLVRKHGDRRLWMLQNHRNNQAMWQMRVEIREALAKGKKVKVRGGMQQPWYTLDKGESQQAKSRLGDSACTLLDLKWHATDGSGFLLSQQPTTLKNATETFYFAGEGNVAEYAESVTGGQSDYGFDTDQIELTVSCDQAKADALWDDIFFIVTIEGEKPKMWRMGWMQGDVYWVGKQQDECDMDNSDHWTPVELGPLNVAEEVAERFSRTPPGHGTTAWGEMVGYSLEEVVGNVARERGLPVADKLGPHMRTDAPTFEDVALHGIRDVVAHRKSAANGGEEVVLEEMCAAVD